MIKINIKSQLNILALGLSTIPFAFYELEGPYGVSYGHLWGAQLALPIDLLNENSDVVDLSSSTTSRYSYVCIYNSQTGYSIGFVPPYDNPSASHTLIKFFLGKIGIDDFYKQHNLDSLFFFIKEKPNRVLENSTDPLVVLNLKEMRKIKPPKCTISSTFITRVTVENGINNVQISKGDKKVDFDDALKDWFNYDKHLSTIIDLQIKSKCGTELISEKGLLAESVFGLLHSANQVS